MTVRAAVTGQTYRRHALLRQLRNHPFYDHEVTVIPYLKRLRTLNETQITQIVESVPVEWIEALCPACAVSDFRHRLVARLVLTVKRGLTVRKQLDLLRVFRVPTETENRARFATNKRRFERGVMQATHRSLK